MYACGKHSFNPKIAKKKSISAWVKILKVIAGILVLKGCAIIQNKLGKFLFLKPKQIRRFGSYP